MDVDVFTDPGPSFEIGVRAAETLVKTPRKVTLAAADGAPNRRGELDRAGEREFTFTAWDEDVLCQLDARVRVEGDKLLVRRLTLLGVADQDPGENTRPACVAEEDPSAARVALRMSQVRFEPRAGQTPLIDGHVVVRAPVSITNRYVKMGPLSGWVAFAGDVRWDGRTKLPELRGRVRGGDVQIDVYRLAKKLEVDAALENDRVEISRLGRRDRGERRAHRPDGAGRTDHRGAGGRQRRLVLDDDARPGRDAEHHRCLGSGQDPRHQDQGNACAAADRR
jgi:hypothetical protein